MRPRRIRRGERDLLVSQALPEHTASMRPRRIRRGELCEGAGHGGRAPRLQCGHGEFAVENEGGMKCNGCGMTMLQCGHGEFAVENKEAYSCDACKREGASMRPRRIRRGERPEPKAPESKPPLCFNAATA